MDNDLPPGFQLDQGQDQEPGKIGYSDLTTSGVPNGFQLDEDKYGGAGQGSIAAIEGGAQGILGPIAPWIEKHVLGVPEQDILGRESAHGVAHGVGEGLGFGLGMMTGTGGPGLIGHAGEAVAGGVEGLARAAAIGSDALGPLTSGADTASKLAGGAARMATEMGLYSASDDASKAVLDVPTTPGQVVAHAGLSALIGGAVGAPLAALGVGARSVLDSGVLKDFTDRLAFRGANLNPNEAMQNELTGAINSFHQIGDEVNGFDGLKAQAISKLLPESVTPEISDQIQSISSKAQQALQQMVEKDVPGRLIKDFQGDINSFLETATDPSASVGDHFDAINQLKNDLQDYSKGRYGINAVQRTAEDYQFVNITKELARDTRLGLEDGNVWGQAADVQKSINQAWKDSIPAVDDAVKKFMSKRGNDYVVDPQRFVSYVNQNGKATSTTIKQQMMGKFIDGMEQFHDTIADVAKKAGIENPIDPIGMGALKESIEKPSLGTKLADAWYDKLGSAALGNAAGAATGNAVLPGMGGAYIGKEVLGPAFGSIIKPMLEKGASLPAFQKSMSYAKAILSGESNLTNSVTNLFTSGSKTLPSHLYPDENTVDKLDALIKSTAQDPSRLIDQNKDLSEYAPALSAAATKTAMTAVTYLSAQRPQNVKQGVLDSTIPISKAQNAPYKRALAIAQQPLLAIDHVKNSTLLPQDVSTIKAIYPDYYNKMSKEMMKSMTDHISNGGEIPYKLRQSISMFMGQPMDSTMSQPSIQSIQSAYAMNRPQPQQQALQGPKKGTSKMGKLSENLQTLDQSRAAKISQA